MHHPRPQEIAVELDRPWEGALSGYFTVFEDEGRYRMYYKAQDALLSEGQLRVTPDNVCYCESDDGIVWRKPELGLIEFEGSRANNIIWQGNGAHGFAPFRDDNPDCPPAQRYKAIGRGYTGDGASALFALTSPDGIHWSLLSEEPVMRHCYFDSQNLAFWDAKRGEYRAYVRDFRGGDDAAGTRDILTATSSDFVHWSKPEWLIYPGAPDEQLYTNQIQPYYRAPHILIGFPMRYIERGWSPSMEMLPELEHRRLRSSAHDRFGMAITDTLLMTSRDRRTFRRGDEAFLRPGPQRPGSWAYGNAQLAWGMVETASALPGAPKELSLYVGESMWTDHRCALRRHTLRIDGFMSMTAPLSGGEFLTKPLIFEGSRLVLNFSTSAAGSIRVEIQDVTGRPLAGFSLADCDEVFGDEIERTVTWRRGESEVSSLAGQAVRLRFVMTDADLFSLRFT